MRLFRRFSNPLTMFRTLSASEYQTRFDILRGNLLGACATFYAWKGSQEKNYESTYGRAIYFWSAALISMQNEWLLSLAKCFEDSSFSKQNGVISVKALLRHHPDSACAQQIELFLQNHKKVIRSISKLRHDRLAHFNAEHLKNPAKLLRKFPIDYGEVEDLFNGSPELISLLDPRTGVSWGLDAFTKTPEYEAKHIMTKIQYFDVLEKEHLERFSRHEIDDPFFPPRK